MDDISKEHIKLFMVFDILGDTIRSGPIQWCVKRKRLEDVKNHTFDLLLIYRIIREHLPADLNFEAIFDYIICHDLPEAITDDITRFQGVSEEEINRVTQIAINYLIERFNKIMDLRTIFTRYEEKADIEAKVASLIDRVHSATTFLKYVSEEEIDVDDPHIIPELAPYVKMVKEQGVDVGDVFYEYHSKRLVISDEECAKYGISREYANKILSPIKKFIEKFYQQKVEGTLLDVSSTFPEKATIYKRN